MDNKCYTKFPDLKAAKDALKDYFKKHNLDPLKSYLKHPVHGKAVSDLVLKLNIERAKILDNYTYRDLANTTKLVTLQYNKYKNLNMATKKKTKKAPKEVEAPKEVKAAKKEKKTSTVASKYDYPLVDGREMTKEEKKKYRAKLRKEGNKAPEKAEAKKAEAKPKKAAKKAPKEEVPAKPLKKAKSKKAKKEED